MSTLVKTTLFALVVAAVLVAFRGPDNKYPQPPAVNNHKWVPGPDTGGTAVSLDSANLCIARYAMLMRGYGFTNTAGQNVNIKIKKTRMVTTGEIFSGRKMLAWLQSTDSLYRSENKVLQVKVQLGVYDDNYLMTYHPNDPALREKYKDRMAIFMMPVDSATGKAGPVMTARVAVTGGGGATTSSGGGKGFDLGGIQP